MNGAVDDRLPEVYFEYVDGLVRFAVHVDAKSGCVRVTSGRNGFAALAETCAIYANMAEAAEHSHWDTIGEGAPEFITTLNDTISDGQSFIYLANEDTIRPPQLVSVGYRVGGDPCIILDPISNSKIVYLVANKDGMATLANALLEMLLSPTVINQCVVCDVRGMDKTYDRIHFVLDELFDQVVSDESMHSQLNPFDSSKTGNL